MKHIKVICDMSWPIKNLLYCLVCGMAKGGEGRKKEIGRGRRKRGILMAVKNN